MYVDLLCIFNLAVNYFLLKLTSLIAEQESSSLRMLAGSLSGAALVPFLPYFPSFVHWTGKLLFPAAMIWIAFRPKGFTQGLLAFIVFFASSLALGGLMFAFNVQLLPAYPVAAEPQGTASASFYTLLFAGGLVWAAVFWGKPLWKERLDVKNLFDACSVTITFGGRKKTLSAYPDTGNRLKEPLTGYPVAVAAYPALKELLPPGLIEIFGDQGMEFSWQKAAGALANEEAAGRFRLVPYYGLQEEGMLLAFKPEAITLQDDSGRLVYDGDFIIAVQHGKMGLLAEHEVLLPLDVCRRLKKKEGCLV